MESVETIEESESVKAEVRRTERQKNIELTRQQLEQLGMTPLEKKKADLDNAMKMIVKQYTEKHIYTDRASFDFDELEEK